MGHLFDVYPLQPIEITRGRGTAVWDKEGRAYLDLYGGHAVISIGHSHPHYIRRVSGQLGELGFYSNSVIIPQQEALAAMLAEESGKADYRLFLCSSGAEANENALKLASFHNGRSRIVAFRRAFHGRTSLAVAVTDNPAISAAVNRGADVVFLPFNDEEALEAYFRSEGDLVSSVIIEGIQGVGGIREASPAFLQAIRRLCDQYGAVYIADGIQCGYGRTGQFFSHDIAGVNADLYTMAKGMGNGFPIGGVLIGPQFEARYGMLGTTFGGNHLACVAAIAVLEVMREESLRANAAQVGAYLAEQLSGFDEIRELRGRGLMIGIDLPEELGHVRRELLQAHGIFTGEAKPNVLRLLPPLNLTIAEADRFLDAFYTTLKSS